MSAERSTALHEDHAPAALLEVIVSWGDGDVLHVAHVAPEHGFCVGDAERQDGSPATDFVIGREALGCQRLPVAVPAGAGVAVVVPRGARVDLIERKGRTPHEALLAAGALTAYPELEGAHQLALPEGASARLACGAFTFQVTLAEAVAQVGTGKHAIGLDRSALPWTASSLAAHLCVLFGFYLLPPTSSALSLAESDAQRRLTSFVLQAREQPPLDPQWSEPGAGDSAGQSGPREQGDPGRAGTPDEAATARRRSAPATSAPRSASPEERRALAQNAGILPALRAAAEWSDAPAVYSAAAATQAEIALGALLGDRIGASAGWGGGAMIGTGRGGGGHADAAVGVGGLFTIGQGASGRGSGRYGAGVSGLSGRNTRVPPRIVAEPPEVRGSLSKEAIRRTIRLHLNEVRHCYEEGLRVRPELQGRVAVRFIIAPSGAVRAAVRQSSDVGDARVEQCIVGAVKRWNFPAPEGGGVVAVTYPFLLQQTGAQ